MNGWIEKEPSIGAGGQARGRPQSSQPVKQLWHTEQSATRDYWQLLNAPNVLQRNTWRPTSKNTKKRLNKSGSIDLQATLRQVFLF